MSHQVHKLWLKVLAVIVISFAPVFFLGTMVSTAEPARFTIDLLVWPLDGVQSFDAHETRFVAALASGFLLGWGLLIWRLSTTVYDHAPEAVRQAVVISVVAWFVVDSLGSITSGTASNVIPNVIILLVGIGPLWRPARDEAAQAAGGQ